MAKVQNDQAWFEGVQKKNAKKLSSTLVSFNAGTLKNASGRVVRDKTTAVAIGRMGGKRGK
jgi:hypothetical protein